MKLSETGFRGVYKRFCIFPIEAAKGLVDQYQGYQKASHVLCYGYIDRDAGLTLEVLCCCDAEDGKVSFYAGNDEVSMKKRISADDDTDFYIISDADDLEKMFKSKIDMIDSYGAGEDVEKTREMEFLDCLRDPSCIDDIQVHLLKDGNGVEVCWVRITGLLEHSFIGTLLNEPNQDFGYHYGDSIGFFLHKTEDGKTIAVSDMNPSIKLKREDLAGGKMLKDAVDSLYKDPSEEHLIDVFELLRDSYVWVPCTAVLSEKDQKDWDELVKSVGDDLELLKGMTLTNSDNIRMIPDILQKDDDYYFPVFSSAEEMGEYGEGFSKIEVHFLEAISMAEHNEKEIYGIVLNPFTKQFIFKRDMFEAMKNSKSRIVD